MSGPTPRPRPGPGELEAARGREVPDVVADDLRLLVVGINPGLWTAWSGHHFARPGNRFWIALHAAGLTPRVLDPSEERELLDVGIGITNMVPRATAAAAELTREELRAGGERLAALVARHRVRTVAVLGMGAYRTAFGRPRAGDGQAGRAHRGRRRVGGPQPERPPGPLRGGRDRRPAARGVGERRRGGCAK